MSVQLVPIMQGWSAQPSRSSLQLSPANIYWCISIASCLPKMPAHLSVTPSVSLSLWRSSSVRLSTCLRVYMSACLRVCVSACPRVCVSACPSVCVSVCLRVCVSACLSVYLSLCLSVIHACIYDTSSTLHCSICKDKTYYQNIQCCKMSA